MASEAAGTRMSAHLLARVALAAVVAAGVPLAPQVTELLSQTRDYSVLPAADFEKLGWDLPDGGRTVKGIADAASGGAFDPQALERATGLGYRASWHVVRYQQYGLDWDITGLELRPDRPDPALPTIAIVHGGSANWYDFFVDPLNGPGLGQYLAQRARVMLITIPGNYTRGGWTDDAFERPRSRAMCSIGS